MPKFLLGGINFRMNFLGSKTIQTAAYGLFESGVKIAPIFILLAYSGNQHLLTLQALADMFSHWSLQSQTNNPHLNVVSLLNEVLFNNLKSFIKLTEVLGSSLRRVWFTLSISLNSESWQMIS